MTLLQIIRPRTPRQGVVFVVVALTLAIAALLLAPVVQPGTAPETGYSVTFMERSHEMPVGTGSVQYESTVDVSVEVSGTNIVRVYVWLEWQDQSISPSRNPGVGFTVEPFAVTDEGGNPVGPVTTSVPPTGGGVFVEVNPEPTNQTVMASSAADAIRLATGDGFHPEEGIGTWTVSIVVTAPTGVVPRPNENIRYSLDIIITDVLSTAVAK